MFKAYGGMIIGKTDYWHPDMVVNPDIKKDVIGCYYVDMRAKHIYEGAFDKDGIPLLEFDGDICYFPVTIAQYALGNFDMYIDKGSSEYLEHLILCADWFVNNLNKINTDLYGYANNYDKDIYGLKKPWLSSLSQGQAMSVLSRAYYASGDNRYLGTCKKMLTSFELGNEKGGVLVDLNNGYFYEEYPSNPPSFVLNGFIFSLWGLLDYYISSRDNKALDLYNKGLNTLENNIGLYNIKVLNWSRYDLFPFKITDIASIFYHKLHIEQLKAMNKLTGKDIYREIYIKWERARNNKLIYINATAYKILHKLSVRRKSNYVPSIGKQK